MTYLELWFGDHAGSYSALLAVVDSAIACEGTEKSAIASSNNKQLAPALNSIIEIAQASPFQELANLASVSATLVKPNQEWTF
ncbi:hypothetical protein SD81_018220 [Tolypothrix campylonemoides VB511288]|nr:hypothetical protein SD81_018220 [Tolypothrix campylonemoides VB511288]